MGLDHLDLSNLLQVVGSIGLMLGGIMGFCMPVDKDSEMVRNAATGATIGTVIGVMIAMSVWLGVLLGRV